MRRILLSLVVVAGLLTTVTGSAVAAAKRTAATPANTALPTISGTALDGQTLTVTSGSWDGTAPITYTYQWQRCNSSGSGCSSIGRATNQNYVASGGDVGKTIRAEVTAKNAEGSNQALSAATAAIASASATAPVSTKQPDPSGKAEDGQKVSVSNGTWTGQTPMTFTYQWQTCTAATVCTDIAGATGKSFDVGPAQVGSLLRAVVTATNAAGKASASSNLTTAVVTKNGTPVNTSLPLITGSTTVGQTLSSSPGNWTGLTSNVFAYQWSRCNSDGSSCAGISGATGASYGIGQVDLGNALRVSVTATNKSGSTSAISSASMILAKVALTARFSATLRTGQEVRHPKGTSPRAIGHYTARVTGKTLRWTLTFSHLTGRPTVASLHKGLRGVSGTAFKTLCRHCLTPAHGTLTLTSAQLDSMLRGRTYVNIRTVKNFYGEVRGQISRVS